MLFFSSRNLCGKILGDGWDCSKALKYLYILRLCLHIMFVCCWWKRVVIYLLVSTFFMFARKTHFYYTLRPWKLEILDDVCSPWHICLQTDLQIFAFFVVMWFFFIGFYWDLRTEHIAIRLFSVMVFWKVFKITI